MAFAVLLLGGLLALAYFLLIPRQGANAVPPARLINEPPGVSAGIHPGDVARDFEAVDLDGRPARLSDYRGSPLVVNFWASWCTSCLAELPVLRDELSARAGEGLKVLAMNVGEGFDDAREFADELGVNALDFAMDPDLSVADAYGIRGLPHSLFIDLEGVIQAEFIGQLDDDTLASYVQAAIDAVPGEPPPDRLRIVTTVAREHVLEAYPDEGADLVRFVSRRFRCDDAYCIEDVLNELPELDGGITFVDLQDEVDEPALLVAFEPDMTSDEKIIEKVAFLLRREPDPLYTRELEVRIN